MLLDDLIAMLAGIWKYASLGYFLANNKKEKKQHHNVSKDVYKANEYAIRLVRLWDELDMLPREVVVKTIVELEGSIIGKKEQLKRSENERKRKVKAELALLRILRTQLEDYLAVRDMPDLD